MSNHPSLLCFLNGVSHISKDIFHANWMLCPISPKMSFRQTDGRSLCATVDQEPVTVSELTQESAFSGVRLGHAIDLLWELKVPHVMLFYNWFVGSLQIGVFPFRCTYSISICGRAWLQRYWAGSAKKNFRNIISRIIGIGVIWTGSWPPFILGRQGEWVRCRRQSGKWWRQCDMQ